MKFDNNRLLLYAVTDRTWLNGETLAQKVEASLRGGATLIQLREKNLTEEEFVKEAQEIKLITDYYGVPLIINDAVEVALKVDAAGVHVGQKDRSTKELRRIFGRDKIIGVSTQTVDQAQEAERDGADYLGVGAVFGTTTKADAGVVQRDTLSAIVSSVSIPVVAIGGIQCNNVMRLAGTGVAGVAVVSAIFGQKDAEQATKLLLSRTREMVQS